MEIRFPPSILHSGDRLTYTVSIEFDDAGMVSSMELREYRIVPDLVREAAEVAELEQELEEL